MNYTLAKKMKDNGFQQHVDTDPHGRTYFFIQEDNLSFVHQGGAGYPPHIDNAHDEGDIMLAPNLSEIIESCGVPFHLNCSLKGYWYAYNNLHSEALEGKGETAEIAVSNLWLELNKTK